MNDNGDTPEDNILQFPSKSEKQNGQSFSSTSTSFRRSAAYDDVRQVVYCTQSLSEIADSICVLYTIDGEVFSISSNITEEEHLLKAIFLNNQILEGRKNKDQ